MQILTVNLDEKSKNMYLFQFSFPLQKLSESFILSFTLKSN